MVAPMQQACPLVKEVNARNKRAHHSLLSKLPNLLDRPGRSLLETHAMDLVPTFALVFRPMHSSERGHSWTSQN
jgi:hypothetical protein